jgi:hypothetical protein
MEQVSRVSGQAGAGTKQQRSHASGEPVLWPTIESRGFQTRNFERFPEMKNTPDELPRRSDDLRILKPENCKQPRGFASVRQDG